jgi:SAM-dependent methyltransferase
MDQTTETSNTRKLERDARAAYTDLSNEYYDARHVTTRNFDLLVRQYLQDSFRIANVLGRWLDVGCGATKLADVVPAHRLFLLDNCLPMLRYSLRMAGSARALAAAGSAFAIPFREQSFSGVFASLGDPFTHEAYFSEAYRILAPRGSIIHIVPAHEWGIALRHARSAPLDRSHFFRGSRDCLAPSLLHRSDELAAMLASCGFHDVTVRDLRLPISFAAADISPDIDVSAHAQGRTPYEIAILTVLEGRVK